LHKHRAKRADNRRHQRLQAALATKNRQKEKAKKKNRKFFFISQPHGTLAGASQTCSFCYAILHANEKRLQLFSLFATKREKS